MKLSEFIGQLKSGERAAFIRMVWANKQNGELRPDTIVEDDMTIISNPPSGHFRITNLYVDSSTGKTVVEYDNTPAK